MKPSTAFSILSSVAIGQVLGQDAPPVEDNPAGVAYTATLPEERFFKGADLEGNVKGSISAVANDDGNGVKFSVNFENFPKEGGPFSYHIHVAPATGGNCTATLAHLDPFARGEEPPCDPADPASCQVGDLSGKHGKITSDPFVAEFVDPYASTKEGIGAFFGNRSIVLHYANKTRITCADFTKVSSVSNGTYPSPSSTGAGTIKGTGSVSPEPSPTVPIAMAGSLKASGSLVLAGLAIFALAL